MNQEKFNKTLISHKKWVAQIGHKKKEEFLIPIDKTAKELVLAYAECKCESCGTETDLQFHHLLPKVNRKFLEFWKYVSQRHYWANIALLCKKCHADIEDRPIQLESMSIPQESINKVKQKYEIGEENER